MPLEKIIYRNDVPEDVKDEIRKVIYEHEKIQWIFSNIPGLLFLTDAEGKILAYYGSHEDFYVKSIDFKEKMVSQLLPVEAADKILQTIREAEKNGISANEYSLLEATGINYYLIQTKKVLSRSQRVLFTHIINNVNDYKNMQHMLRENEERYRILFEKSLNGEAIADIETGILVDCNQALADMIRCKRDELVGQNQTILHPKSKSNPFKNHIISPGKTERTQLLTKTGEILEVEIKASNLTINGRKYLHGEFHDITAKEKAEKDLKDSEEKYRTLYFNSQDALMTMVAPEWKFDSCNQKALEMFGLQDENEFVAHLLWDFSPEYQPDNQLSKEKALKMIKIAVKRKSNYFDWVHRRNNGDEFPATVLLTKLEINGKLFIQATVRDVSERKKAQLALIEAERSSAIGVMAGGIAHDFNNALQIILGNIDLAMLEPCVSKPMQKYLQNILTSAIDTASRVKQLQRFSGQIAREGEYTTIDINFLINDVIAQSRPLWKDKAESEGIVYWFEKTTEEELIIWGSEGELRSAFYNLLKNGLEVMRNGGKISWTCERKFDQIIITITDQGKGMTEKEKSSCFQPFYSTKGMELGRGLGLSGVYSIIKEHKGKIQILRTALGKGTTFEIVLPAYKVDFEKDEKTVQQVNNVSAKVLWVDDEEQIRDVVKLTMKKLGHIADIVASGKEALRLLSESDKKYDLIVTDLGMPEMSGWQLAEQISQLYPDIKIAIASGWGLNISNEEKIKYGIGYVLSKPFQMSEIKVLIEEVMLLKNK